jgi:hypothetical protein
MGAYIASSHAKAKIGGRRHSGWLPVFAFSRLVNGRKWRVRGHGILNSAIRCEAYVVLQLSVFFGDVEFFADQLIKALPNTAE